VREEDPPAPVSEYGRSKLEAEREALAIGDQVEIAIVRPSVVYGPRDAALAALFRLVSLGIAPRLRADPSISLIHARDLVRCVLLAADRPEARGRWFYAAGPAMRLSAITEAIGRAYGRRPLSLPVPGTLLLAAGLASDLAARVTRRPNAFSRRKAGEMLHSGWVCATDLALHELGFKAEIEIEDGFRETAAWYHRNNWR
jgi:nucleoside-diphosphate-sugar epimerase